jgi:hypothetical protein
MYTHSKCKNDKKNSPDSAAASILISLHLAGTGGMSQLKFYWWSLFYNTLNCTSL